MHLPYPNLYSSVAAEVGSETLDMLYDALDESLSSARWGDLNTWLLGVDPSRLSSTTLGGLLMMTRRCASLLPARQRIAEHYRRVHLPTLSKNGQALMRLVVNGDVPMIHYNDMLPLLREMPPEAQRRLREIPARGEVLFVTRTYDDDEVEGAGMHANHPSLIPEVLRDIGLAGFSEYLKQYGWWWVPYSAGAILDVFATHGDSAVLTYRNEIVIGSVTRQEKQIAHAVSECERTVALRLVLQILTHDAKARGA